MSEIKFKNLGTAENWKGIPKELQECMEKGHGGEKDYIGKKGTTVHTCPKCKIRYTSENHFMKSEDEKK